jgi:hypothetical protein
MKIAIHADHRSFLLNGEYKEGPVTLLSHPNFSRVDGVMSHGSQNAGSTSRKILVQQQTHYATRS